MTPTDVLVDPERERQAATLFARSRSIGALDHHVELEQAVESCDQLVHRPRVRLPDEFLEDVWVELHRRREVARALAGRDPVGDLEQLTDARVELGEDDGLGRGLEQSLELLGGLAESSLPEGVEEGERRTRDGLRHELAIVVHADLVAVGIEEGELLQLADDDLALPSPVDVALSYLSAHSPGQLDGDAPTQLD